MRFISFFAGIGGIDLGLLELGEWGEAWTILDARRLELETLWWEN